jgi:hypothetical protein
VEKLATSRATTEMMLRAWRAAEYVVRVAEAVKKMKPRSERAAMPTTAVVMVKKTEPRSERAAMPAAVMMPCPGRESKPAAMKVAAVTMMKKGPVQMNSGRCHCRPHGGRQMSWFCHGIYYGGSLGRGEVRPICSSTVSRCGIGTQHTVMYPCSGPSRWR